MLTQLQSTFQEALIEQARTRNKELTPFDLKVSNSIFTAACLASEDRERGVCQYRVVSAPTSSGKSSFAQAFIKAYLTVYPDASVLYLVETIDQAEAVFREMSQLLGKSKVAVWTSAHDRLTSRDGIERKYGIVPSDRFALTGYPVAIATHNFYRGSRAEKAVVYNGEDRRLIFVDEKASDVTIYDVDTGLIKTVRDQLAEKHTSNIEHVHQLTRLHDHLESVWQSANSKSPYDTLPASVDLSWFCTDKATDYITSSNEHVKNVFGFGRALANGFAFLSRYDAAGKGARFVGYELTMPLRPGTILLDATADIDGVSLIVNNREPVEVPRVDFCNLSITHIQAPLPKGSRISNIAKTAKKARPYAEWIRNTIIENSQPGEKVLAVVHKSLLDLEFLPNAHHSFDLPYDLHGRMVCLINWGTGIGSNRWKDASAVFLFGEFHLPKRALVGTALALKQQPADVVSLAPFQSPKASDPELLALRDGHLCRHQKQLAMRGNARNIDADGVCGVQRLYVTGEFSRFVRYKDQLFPGATVNIKGREKRLRGGGREALIALLFHAQTDVITTAEVKTATGIDFQKNRKRYLSSSHIQQAMSQNGWEFLAGTGGRGNMGCFIRMMAVAA